MAFIAVALLAGLASSLGPCVAPRYLVVAAALASGAGARHLAVFAFGSVAALLVYAMLGSLLPMLRSGSHAIYAAIAFLLIASGIPTIGRCGGRCLRAVAPPRSVGGMLLLGLSTSLALSPCCTPFAIALGLQSTWNDVPIVLAALLAFGFGHAVPLLVLAAGGMALRKLIVAPCFTEQLSLVSGTLSVGLGTFYAILA